MKQEILKFGLSLVNSFFMVVGFFLQEQNMSRNLLAIYNLLHFSCVANRGTWYFFAAADRLARQDQSDEASSCVRFPEVAK